jgi:hypothetical protein
MTDHEELPPEPGTVPDTTLGIPAGEAEGLPLDPPDDEPDEPTEINDDEEDDDGDA